MHELLSTYEYNEKNVQKELDNMHIETGPEVFRHKCHVSI